MQRPDGHHAAPAALATPEALTRDTLRRMSAQGPRFWAAVLLLGALFALGIVGFAIRATGGFDDRLPWGYYAALFAYLLTTVQSAPLVAVALRLTKAHWRKPLVRVSELFALVAVLNLLVFLPLMALIPSLEGRRSLWIARPLGAPHAWDLLAVLFLVICGLGILYASALPDLAAVRDHGSGFRKRFADRLAGRWRGTPRQWRLQRAALAFLGAFYFLFLVFSHTLLSTDVAESLIPGWKDAIFPAFHALSGLQSALAITMVTLFILRTFGGYREYIRLEQFWNLGKIMLALSLLWFYFWFSGFITYWYGRTPNEQNLLKFLMFESYRLPFLLAFFFNFVGPFAILMWNPLRKSVLGPTAAASLILVGTLFDRIRIYVAAFSIEDSTAHTLDYVPAAHLPGAPDILIIIGGIAGAALIFLLATRLIPVVSLWELKEGLILRRVKTLLRREVTVLGKPE